MDTWVCRYEGQSILKLASGLFWSPEVGSYPTLPEIRQAIDAWLAQRDARGFDAGYFLT